MSVQFIEDNQIIEARFLSDINFETSRHLELELQEFPITEDVKRVTVDFHHVKFIDSTGISVLIRWLHPLTQKMSVEIVHANEPVKNILRICKLDQLISIK